MVGMTITRHETASTGEYRAHIADSDEIGRLTWVDRNGVRYAEHTLVPSAIGGRGVAGRLVEALVADARENHFRIAPMCSYVLAAFQRHPEWADVRA